MRPTLFIALAALGALALATGTAWAGIIANPVPEPSTMAILAVAVGGAALAKFRRRK